MGPVWFARFADYRDCGFNQIMSSANKWENSTFQKPLNPYMKDKFGTISATRKSR